MCSQLHINLNLGQYRYHTTEFSKHIGACLQEMNITTFNYENVQVIDCWQKIEKKWRYSDPASP